jgi:zinc transporter 1/2/3
MSSQECLAGLGAPGECLAMRGGHVEELVMAAAAAGVGSTTASTTPYGLPLNAWKVLFQAALTAINVACWLIPLRSKHVNLADNPLALSLANAFSGGVFLALAFGHLIPECLHGFPSDWNETAPFYLVLAGYLLIFFVEKVAFDAHDMLHDMQSGGGGGHAHGQHEHADPVVMNNGDGADITATIVPVAPPPAPTPVTGRSAVILLGALGVHSILEMMALGLSDTFSDSALLTGSIALHQPAESIALLVAFLKSGLEQKQIVTYLSIFSCMGPIGVALGMAVNEYAAPVVDAMMLAVVAGTFVYVGATEIIPEEWEDSRHKWKKFAALMTGIVGIAGITQYTMSLGGHDHGHGHGH